MAKIFSVTITAFVNVKLVNGVGLVHLPKTRKTVLKLPLKKSVTASVKHI
jgi:hypothetical protein